MPPRAYVLKPNPKMYKEKCLIPISPLPDSAGLAILGDTFIRNYYTSFDFDKNTVTFASNAAHEFGAVVGKDESFFVFIFAILIILVFTCVCVAFNRYKIRQNAKKGAIAALVAESDPLNDGESKDSESDDDKEDNRNTYSNLVE